MLNQEAHLGIFIVDQSVRIIELEPFEDQEILIDRSRVVEVAAVKKEPAGVRTAVASTGGPVSDEPPGVDLGSKEIQ